MPLWYRWHGSGPTTHQCTPTFYRKWHNYTPTKIAICHFLVSKIWLYKNVPHTGARQIRALRVKCDNLDKSCEWTGELGELEAHLQSCDYTLVSCSNECKAPNSTEVRKLLAKDLAHHLDQECPREETKCPICSQVGEYEQMRNHDKKCSKVRVSCPNHPCSSKILLCNVNLHLASCKFQPMSCKYAEVGCEERPLRKDLKKHEDDDQLHCRITTKKVLDLNAKVADLSSKLLKVSTKKIVFKLTDFEKHKKDLLPNFFSPSFYTSPTGYKMCVRVDANGNGDGKGTHVSVFAYLMKGDNDDYLTWPFTGTVTFELLNQLEDKNHHKETVTFPTDDVASQRVVDSERAPEGWGFPKFISHTDLDSKKCQYLKDTALIFRVSAQVSEYKPWLECTV